MDSASTARSTTSSAPGQASPTAGPTRPSGAGRTADLAYATVYGGAIGGSAIAIFFLILDAFAGHPLFTPSLMGTVLFTAADPSAVTAVRVDMVAYFSLVHFATFFALGAVASRLYLDWTPVRGRVPALAGVLFILLTATLLVVDRLAMPGVVSALGIIAVLGANAVTATAMSWFVGGALADRVGSRTG